MTEAAKTVWHCRKMGLARHALTKEAKDQVRWMNRVALGHRPKGVAAVRGREAGQMMGVKEEEDMGEACKAMMAEIKIATTSTTEAETETDVAALATIE